MALLRYTLLRVLLLVAVAGVFWVIGFRGLWLLLVAIFVSGLISLFVLTRTRDAASAALYDRMQSVRRRMDEQTAAEDAWDESRRQGGPADRTAAERSSEGAAPGSDTAAEDAAGDSGNRSGTANDQPL